MWCQTIYKIKLVDLPAWFSIGFKSNAKTTSLTWHSHPWLRNVGRLAGISSQTSRYHFLFVLSPDARPFHFFSVTTYTNGGMLSLKKQWKTSNNERECPFVLIYFHYTCKTISVCPSFSLDSVVCNSRSSCSSINIGLCWFSSCAHLPPPVLYNGKLFHVFLFIVRSLLAWFGRHHQRSNL